jgi:stage V sporulation protein R
VRFEQHRVLLADGSTWRRLDELRPGDKIAVSGGQRLWAREVVQLDWRPARPRVGLGQVAEAAGVSVWTVLRHRAGRRVESASAVAAALEPYEAPENQALPRPGPERKPVRLPERVDEPFAQFLGYLVGDGHISAVEAELRPDDR